MQPRATAQTLLLAAALSGCGGQHAPTVDHRLPAAIATPPNDAALLQISRTSGTAELLRATTLVARAGTAVSGLPAIARILGVSGADDQTVYATDNAGRLIAIDLRNARSRVVPGSARQFTTTPDGTILGVDSAHHPVRMINRALATFKVPLDKGAQLLRGPGDQIMTVGNRAGSLQVLGPTGEVRHLPLPNGRVTGAWVGDLVAVTTDSGVVFVDPSGKAPPRKGPARFVKIRGTPTVAAFSPSGHRLYVARKSGGLVMVDRFNRTVLKELPLHGIADALRADRSGRWLLAHGTQGDSLWVIDVTRWAVAWNGTAPWAEDLPQVIDGHMLLLRRKADLDGFDLTSDSTSMAATLSGGAADLYIMLPWVPKAAPTTDLATAPAAAGQPAAPPPATGTASTPPPATSVAGQPPPPPPPVLPAASPTGTLYVQLSASQNSVYSETLAKQLRDGGYPAKVLDPKTSDETYRVVVGPYASRADADSVGKRLGRPYFIINPGSGDT